jgi:hypothetical protein
MVRRKTVAICMFVCCTGIFYLFVCFIFFYGNKKRFLNKYLNIKRGFVFFFFRVSICACVIYGKTETKKLKKKKKKHAPENK